MLLESMKTINFSVVLGVLLVFSGCGKGSPPEPLSPDHAVTELTRSFAKSTPELKELAAQAVAALQAKRYPEASALLMQISRAPKLGTQERETVNRTTIGVNRLLQEAQAKGDPQSAEYLRRLQQSR